MKTGIVEYDELNHEITLAAPEGELYERARLIPAIQEYPKHRLWKVAATPATAGLIVELYGREISYGPGFDVYLAERTQSLIDAFAQANAKEWPEIPVTSIQPTGVWMHQRRAFWYAWYLEAAMLDITMGGGKTKIATDLMQNWGSRDVIIISTLGGLDDAWLPHLEKHLLSTPAEALSRTQFKKIGQFVDVCDSMLSGDPLANRHRIVLINHEAFWREPFRSWSRDRKWDLIIDDEIHREKSAGSLQSGFLHQLSLRSRKRLGLTGTLMPHSPLDVYGQYRVLDRGIFGTNNARFQERYAIMGGFENRQVLGFKRVEEIVEKINTITIHIDDSEQGLPAVAPPIKHMFDLEAKVRTVYDELDEEFIAEWRDGTITAANAGVKLLRLHQLACGLLKLDGEDKAKRIGDNRLKALREVLTDFARNEPVVVYSRFKPDLHAIRDVLEKTGRKVSVVGGGYSELKEWKAGRTDALVGQIQAVKESIDLTRSSVGIFYSTGTSLGDYLQTRKRQHRPPQSRMVRFIHILARGTRDVDTYRALLARRDVLDEIARLARRGI
jgi:hypothetical protein